MSAAKEHMARGGTLAPAADLTDAKAAARRSAFDARKIAHKALKDTAPAKAAEAFIAARFAEIPADGRKTTLTIAGYRPIRTEIDPTALMMMLLEMGHSICVPVIDGAGLPLRFREWRPDAPVETGAFGAEIPTTGDWLEPELLIAPLVAFDSDCWRLGYGGGFYDRTLAQLSARRPTRAVGFAYSAQVLPNIPRESTDRPLDAVVTETGVIRRGRR